VRTVLVLALVTILLALTAYATSIGDDDDSDWRL